MMKKVVINSCFGGFGLSLIAKERLAEMKGLPKLTHYITDYEYALYKKTDANNESAFVYSVTKDLGDEISMDDFFSKANEHFPDFDYERHDDDLVRVVEELGDKANCFYSKLEIVEIPKNAEYVIEDYDGNEWIAEKHRTWGA